MPQEHINYGTAPNDGTGDTLRESQRKAESNFNELYEAINGGSASTTYIVDGENTTVAGNGTSVEPYQINVPNVEPQNLQQVTDQGNRTTSPLEVSDAENTIYTQLSNNTLYFWNSAIDFINSIASIGNEAFRYTGNNNKKIQRNYGDQDYETDGNLNIFTADRDGEFTEVLSINGEVADIYGNVSISIESEVTSVNGQTGGVVLDADDISDSTTTNKWTNDSEKSTWNSKGNGTVTNVTGTTNEITVASGTTTPVVGISSSYTSARDSVANAKVENNLTPSTTVAPSKTAVNTALALKANIASPAFTGTPTTPTPTAINTSIANTEWIRANTPYFLPSSTTTPVNAALVATETIVSALLIDSNETRLNTIIDYEIEISKPMSDGTGDFYFYVNSAPNLTGAQLIGRFTFTAAQRNLSYQKRMKVESGQLYFSGVGNVSGISNIGVTINSIGTAAFNNANANYLIFASRSDSGTNIVIQKSGTIKIKY